MTSSVGAIANAAGGIAIGSKLNLISTTLVNNYSPVGGGILAGTGSVITVTNSAIISNVATGSNAGGGGLTIAGGATAAIKSSLIASNTSVSGGGGIYSNGNLTVEDSTIQYNTNSGIYTNGPFVLRRTQSTTIAAHLGLVVSLSTAIKRLRFLTARSATTRQMRLVVACM